MQVDAGKCRQRNTREYYATLTRFFFAKCWLGAVLAQPECGAALKAGMRHARAGDVLKKTFSPGQLRNSGRGLLTPCCLRAATLTHVQSCALCLFLYSSQGFQYLRSY